MLKELTFDFLDDADKEALRDDIIKNAESSSRDWTHFCKVISSDNKSVFDLAVKMMDNIDYAIDGNPDYESFHDLFINANDNLTNDLSAQYKI